MSEPLVTPLTREQLCALRYDCILRAANGRGREFWLESARKLDARLTALDAASTASGTKGERQT